MKKIVIASNNPGKLREFAALLAPFDFAAIPQGDFNLAEAAEPHPTFIENALAKARHATRLTGLPALADDSGICALALGGAPGAISARYAGEPRSDTRNNEKLVRKLAAHADKRAFYHCTLVLLMHEHDPHPLIASGQWFGEIIDTPRGAGGFGYDPHFFLPEYGCTAAELDAPRKNTVSHRGKAMAELSFKLKQQQAFSV